MEKEAGEEAEGAELLWAEGAVTTQSHCGARVWRTEAGGLPLGESRTLS